MKHALRLALFPFIVLISLVCAVNLKIGVALAVVSAVSLFCLHSLEAAFLAVMFCIPFDRLFILGEGLLKILTVTKCFILLTIAAWLINVLIRKDATPIQSLYKRRTSILILAYLVVSIVSLVNAHEIFAALGELFRRTSLVVLYFLVINIVRSRKTLNRSINALLLGSVFVCGAGIYELITQDMVLPEAARRDDLAITDVGATRVQGLAGNSNLHAAILTMLLPLALVRAFQAKGPFQIAMTYGLVMLFICNIYVTNTRLGLLGMLLAVVGVFVLSDIRHKWLKLGSIGAVLLGALLLLALDENRLSTDRYTGESGTKTVEYRIGWIRMSWEMVKDHPFLGVGVGNYIPEYNNYRRTAAGQVPMRRMVNHNGYMQVWAEMGTIGLACFLALLLSVPLELRSSTRHQEGDKELRQLRVGVLVSFGVWVLLLGIIPMLLHEVAWLVVGLGMVLGDLPPTEAKTNELDSCDG